jgi:hypothetical protein
MVQKLNRVFLAISALVIASLVLASQGIAQDRSTSGTIQLAEVQKKFVAPKGAAPKTGAPRVLSGPKTVAPKRVISPKVGAPKVVAPKRVVVPKGGITPKTGAKKITPKTLTPKVVTPKAVTPKGIAPKIVGPSKRGLGAIGARGTGRVVIGGRNYSVWRGSHRVRYGGRWATLVALGALSVFLYEGASYYPYAYISASGPYCEGVTPDGCVLRWEEVPTLEGPPVFQCVAYCPWQ